MQYRNNIAVIVKGDEVEPHSLWELKKEVLVLVDDDQYVEHQLTKDFYKV